jgi:2-hydroxychromene-2-carboxylate isomerase
MTTQTPEQTERTPVEFWFDPLCPWAWMTSRWVLEVQKVRRIAPSFHVMSLAYLNEDKDVPDDYREKVQAAWGPVRVVTAALNRHGQDVVLPLYTAMGERIHPQGRDLQDPAERRRIVEESLAQVGLPTALADAMGDDAYDEDIRKSHHSGMDQVGTEVGTPVISVDGVAFFGPVVTPAPKGEDAGKLWDGVLAVAATPGFYELKRSREKGPDFS